LGAAVARPQTVVRRFLAALLAIAAIAIVVAAVVGVRGRSTKRQG
jgi:hypothetical protein